MNPSTAALHPVLDAAMWGFAIILVIAFFLAVTQYIERLLEEEKNRERR